MFVSADAKQPRYARVNTLKTTLEEALRLLQSLEGTEAVKQDPVIPNLLVFPPGTDLHDHALVKDGRLILQVRSRRKVEDDKRMMVRVVRLTSMSPLSDRKLNM